LKRDTQRQLLLKQISVLEKKGQQRKSSLNRRVELNARTEKS
jgi:hypothetical protein